MKIIEKKTLYIPAGCYFFVPFFSSFASYARVLGIKDGIKLAKIPDRSKTIVFLATQLLADRNIRTKVFSLKNCTRLSGLSAVE